MQHIYDYYMTIIWLLYDYISVLLLTADVHISISSYTESYWCFAYDSAGVNSELKFFHFNLFTVNSVHRAVSGAFSKIVFPQLSYIPNLNKCHSSN